MAHGSPFSPFSTLHLFLGDNTVGLRQRHFNATGATCSSASNIAWGTKEQTTFAYALTLA